MRRKLIIGALCVAVITLLLGADRLWRLISPVIHKDIINRYAGEYKFDPLFIMALVKVESNFSHRAVSPAGAVGLMQLLPSTAQQMAAELGMQELTLKDIKQPETNIRLGFHYLDKLRRQTGGDTIQMLAAYNAGYSNMLTWKKNNAILNIDDIGFPETQEFVKRVLKTYGQLKKIQKIKKIIEFT